MDTKSVWDYRVVRKTEHGEEWLSIQEVYYDDDKPMAQTIDLQVEGVTITEMRTQLEQMLKSLGQPVLDESDIVDNPVNTKTIEDRVSGLEVENTEMRDRLSKLSKEMSKKIRENLDKLRGL